MNQIIVKEGRHNTFNRKYKSYIRATNKFLKICKQVTNDMTAVSDVRVRVEVHLFDSDFNIRKAFKAQNY